MWAKWNSLAFTQRFAFGSLFLFLLAMPVAIYLALSPTSPFSQAQTPVSGPGGDEIPATLSLSPDIINAQPNETFTLDVVLDTGSHNVAAADVTLAWGGGNSMLKLVTVDIEGVLPVVLEAATYWVNSPTNTAMLKFTVGSQAENPLTGVGTIAKLTFQTTTEGGNGISFDAATQVAAVYQQVNVASQTYGAQVNVVKSASTNLSLSLLLENVDKTPATADPAQTFTLSLESNSASPSAYIANGSFSDGAFNALFTNLKAGVYNAFIKGPAHLRKSLGQVNILSGTTNVLPTPIPLVAGDIVDNNTVDIFDYSIIVQDFGPKMPTEGSPADLDLDGDVDIFDYSLIVQNFGLSGE